MTRPAREETATDAWRRGHQLESLLRAAFHLASAEEIPGKLGLAPASWQALRDFADDTGPAPADPAPVLSRVYRALQGVGLGDRYMAIMRGLTFPLAAAGVQWARQLGPASPALDAFGHALTKLRGDWDGLRLARHVAISGEPVDWAIAGLLPSGEPLRLAIQVRPEPGHLEALAEDLADDAVAEAGFSILMFRDWQLRFAGACALHVATHLHRLAPLVRVPAKLVDPDDDHPVHRVQASPMILTPRSSCPNWALRQALRETHPDQGREALLPLYRDQLLERSVATAEPDEWTVWG